MLPAWHMNQPRWKAAVRSAVASVAAVALVTCGEAGGAEPDAGPEGHEHAAPAAAAPFPGARAPAPDTAGAAGVVAAPARPAEPASVRWTPDPVPEGTLFTVFVEGGEPAVVSATGEFAGEPLHFAPAGEGTLAALAAAPLDSTGARLLRLTVTHAGGATDERTLEVTVARGDYTLQRLTVAPQYATYPPEIQVRIDREWERAMAVSRASHATPRMWEPPFVLPRDSRITSGFGHGRIYNGVVQSRHTGTDFAGAVGDPIVAPARGIVALADTFYLGGRVLYIDHGAGLVTGYLHLSAHEVAEGDVVEPGQLIARVGATGRVTGPHLHFIVRYGAHAVDFSSLRRLADAGRSRLID